MRRFLLKFTGVLAGLYLFVELLLLAGFGFLRINFPSMLEDLRHSGISLRVAQTDFSLTGRGFLVGLEGVRYGITEVDGVELSVDSLTLELDLVRSLSSLSISLRQLDIGYLNATVSLPHLPQRDTDWEQVLRDIDRYAEFVGAGDARFSGGELVLVGWSPHESDRLPIRLEPFQWYRQDDEVRGLTVRGEIGESPVEVILHSNAEQRNLVFSAKALDLRRLSLLAPASAGVEIAREHLSLINLSTIFKWDKGINLQNDLLGALPQSSELKIGSPYRQELGQEDWTFWIQRISDGWQMGSREAILKLPRSLARQNLEEELPSVLLPATYLYAGPKFEDLNLGIQKIDLNEWVTFALGLADLPQAVRDELQQLHIRGTLENITVSAPRFPQFNVSARVVDGSTVPIYGSIPGLKGISGVFNLRESGLVFYGDTPKFVLDLAGIFPAPWEILDMRAKLTVGWANDSLDIGISETSGQFAGGESELLLLVQLPFTETRPQKLEVQARINGAQLQDAWQYTPILPETRAISEYLRTALLAGRSEELDLAVWANLTKPNALNIHMEGTGEGIRFRYADDWPALEQGRGTVRVIESRVQVSNGAGYMKDLRIVEGAQVNVAPGAVAGATDIHLFGEFASDVEVALNFLRATPLAELIGAPLEAAVGQGPARGYVDGARIVLLPTPQEGSESPEEELAEFVGEIAVDFHGANLAWPQWGLEFESTLGRIIYDSDGPLRSENLRASLFGYPTRVRLGGIGSPGDPGSKGIFYLDGYLDGDGLSFWLEQWAGFVEGSAPYSARFEVAMDDQQVPGLLVVETDLIGMDLNLPIPVGKHSDESALTRINMELNFVEDDPSPHLISVNQKEWCADLGVTEKAMGGNVMFHGSKGAKCAPGQTDWQLGTVNLLGHTAYLNADQVLEMSLKVDELATQSEEEYSTIGLVDIRADRVSWSNLSFANMHMMGEGDAQVLNLNLESEDVAGRLAIYYDDAIPMEVDLDRLNLPRIGEDASIEQDFDPNSVGLFRFNVKDLRYRDISVGGFGVSGKPLETGYGAEFLVERFEPPEGGDVQLRYGAGGSYRPMSLVWMKDPKLNTEVTLFRGGGSLVGLDWLLRELGDQVTASGLEFLFDIGWLGGPPDMDLQTAFGSIDVSLLSVNFDLEEVESIDVLQFANSLIKLLNLDFSTGVFSRVDSKITLNAGEIDLLEFIGHGGAEIDLYGGIKLDPDTGDADLDLRGSLIVDLNSLVNAGFLLTTGNPAALAIGPVLDLLLGPIFGVQIGEILSYDLHIAGPLEDLTMDASIRDVQSSASNLRVTDISRFYECPLEEDLDTQQDSGTAEEDSEARHIRDRCYDNSTGDSGIDLDAL